MAGNNKKQGSVAVPKAQSGRANETKKVLKPRKVNDRSDLPEERARRALGVTRRSIWYILRVAAIIVLCVLLCYGVFLEAMYVSNIYIIVTEGMEMRADCILGNISQTELQEHFSEAWLKKDKELTAGKYDAFHVDSYDYRLSIKKFTVFPWSKTATLVVIERVPNIQAAPYSDDTTDPIPEWTTSQITITLEKDSETGRWYITKLEKDKNQPKVDPAPTPDYSKLETDIPHY